MRALYSFRTAVSEDGERLTTGGPEDERNVLATSLDDALTLAREWVEADSPAEYRPNIVIEVVSIRMVGVVDWPLEAAE